MEIAHRQAEVCAALGDYHRMLLLYAVADEARNVSDLVQRLGISQPAVSRHLRIMRECGIVSSRRQGKLIYYVLTDQRIMQAVEMIRTTLTEQMQRGGHIADSAAQQPRV
jgi:ArsR family transcriptional regulator, cadmium/lead-responsive transcriptional repressor